MPLGFTLNFFGTDYSGVYINNNGNLTLDASLGNFTPFDLTSTEHVIIAPYFADVDTRTGNVVTFGTGTVADRPALGVNWPGVGCYSQITSVLNDFQVLLIDRSDVAAGDFDIEFNYDQTQWESGQSSGGDTACQGGFSARVGNSNGTGEPGTFFELPGSAVNGAFLDSNLTTGLINNSLNSSTLGRYLFQVRGGVVVTPTPQPTPTPTPDLDDKFTSLGSFSVLVNERFRPLLEGYPGYDGVSRLKSPTLFDPETVVGRSVYHLVGDSTDTEGALVGSAQTVISDSDFSLVPDGFEAPAGSREIHTEIRSLNLTAMGGLVAVRAGAAAPDQPLSPGEVQSKSASGDPADDFPADSYFNVFVEVDMPAFPGTSLPAGAASGTVLEQVTLYNKDPLLVFNDNLTDPPALPPRVVYVHGNTSAVPVFFKSDNLPFWDADDLFGWLVLAGHGASFDDSPEDITEFEEEIGTLPEMTVPAVLVVPGWIDSCVTQEPLVVVIGSAFSPSRVDCFDYASTRGAAFAATQLVNKVAAFKSSLDS